MHHLKQPYFHTDGEGFTHLYYPMMEEYDLDEGGETQFLLDDNILGIMQFQIEWRCLMEKFHIVPHLSETIIDSPLQLNIMII